MPNEPNECFRKLFAHDTVAEMQLSTIFTFLPNLTGN